MDKVFEYRGYTLVDITKTGITITTEDTIKQRNQQRNWETISQILGLRTQLFELTFLGSVVDDVAKYQFGVNYTGLHRIWSFKFSSEYENIYLAQHDRYGVLKMDFKDTPIILGLEETALPPLPLIYVSGPDKNTYFNSNVT